MSITQQELAYTTFLGWRSKFPYPIFSENNKTTEQFQKHWKITHTNALINNFEVILGFRKHDHGQKYHSRGSHISSMV